MKTTRRDFLKAGVTTAGVASGAAATEVVFSADASPEQPVPPMPPSPSPSPAPEPAPPTPRM